MNEITIGDKIYISAKRAAEITGYARDYVGQLCREGHVDAKMVGRSWYVFEASIRAHRFGPESIPAGVASESAKIVSPEVIEEEPEQASEDKPVYTSEAPTLLPELTPASLQELLPPAEETLTDMQSAWKEWFDQKKKSLEVPEIESPEVIDARNDAYNAEKESEEAIEEVADEEEESFSVPLQRIQEEYEPEVPGVQEEVVSIHHIEPIPVPTYTPSPAPHMDMRREVSPTHSVASVKMEYWDEFAPSLPSQGRVIQERVITKKGSANRKGGKSLHRSNAPIIAVLIGVSVVSLTIAAIGTGYATKYLSTLPAENNPVINFLIGSQKISR